MPSPAGGTIGSRAIRSIFNGSLRGGSLDTARQVVRCQRRDMHQTALVALMHPIQKITLGGSRKVEKIHDFGNHFPGRMATQSRAMHTEKFHRACVVVVTPVVERGQWPAVSQYV